MVNSFTYKQKLQGLGILALLMIVISARLAMLPTLKEYNLFKTQTESAKFQNLSVTAIKSAEAKSYYISLAIDSYSLDTLDNAKNLLSVVSAYCNKNNIELKEYKPAEKRNYEGFTMLTRLVTVEGSFSDCLKLHYQLETQTKCGRIGSVVYKSYFNQKDKQTYLDCSIYLLNVIGYEKEK